MEFALQHNPFHSSNRSTDSTPGSSASFLTRIVQVSYGWCGTGTKKRESRIKKEAP